MATVTVYCVQPYWRASPDRLAHGELQQFKDEARARRAADATARRVGGALVYMVEGDPDFEAWGRPKFIASLGDVPDVRF